MKKQYKRDSIIIEAIIALGIVACAIGYIELIIKG